MDLSADVLAGLALAGKSKEVPGAAFTAIVAHAIDVALKRPTDPILGA